MRFASSITAHPEADAAVEELLAPLDRRVTPGMIDLAFLFCTAHYEDDFETVAERVAEFLPAAVLVGCTAEGTIGAEREIERMPSMALLAGTLPDVRINPFHVQQSQLEATNDHHDWERLVGVAPESDPVFVALADPFRIDVLSFVERLNRAYPQVPLFGGVASAGSKPKENLLLLNGEIVREGIVGVALTGNLVAEAVVSQGCRPIGKHFVVTKGERNVLRELGGKPTLRRLREVLEKLTPAERKLAEQSLLLGRAIDEYRSEFTRGDFLIHNIMGADTNTGALAIAGPARVGTTVQFHVRDAASADEDLRTALGPYADGDIRGALLFSCNGRGTRMWPKQPGHDARALRETVGDVPVAGFFCAGEFGPVGGQNFVHGFTASVALLRPRVHDPIAEML